MIDQIDEATTKKIYDHYQKGEGSIQAIARTYRVTVETVLHIIGQDELMSVPIGGDMIDQEEAGTVPVKGAETVKVSYTSD